MLLAAFWILTAAVILGMGLSLFHLGLVSWRSRVIAALHSVAGAAGLSVLIWALQGPVHGFANGVESFGEIAAFGAGAALAIGAVFVLFPRSLGRGWLIGVHATLGIAAFVFLSGYVLLG